MGYKAARLLSAHSSPVAADYLHFYPPVKSDEELSDLSARINWYLPDRTVPIFVEGAPGRIVRPDAAPWMDPPLVDDPGWSETQPAGVPEYVFWRLDVRRTVPFLRRARRSVVADPALYFVSDKGYADLRDRYCRIQPPSGTAALDALLARGGPGKSCFVLATGPSAAMVDPATVDADLRITCNSAVADEELMTQLKPDMLVFSDPVFHFGPSRYAAKFREDLYRLVDSTDVLLGATDHWAKILLAHRPDLAERLLILHVDPASPWRWPTRDDLTVRLTGNVLTVLMLPLAFAVADEVRIAGCDGRKASEKYFWKHNKRTQYDDELMRSAFAAHEAFFRDRDYGQYYEQHCRELEELLATGERGGKRAVGVTPSHIPALRSRGAPAFTDVE